MTVSIRKIYSMSKADVLDRSRRPSFFLAIAVSIALGYTATAGYLTVGVGNYTLVHNGAWTGAVVTLVCNLLVSLFGFYLIRDNIHRDRVTNVGLIIAASPMSKSSYILAKGLSNVVALGIMVSIVTSASAAALGLRHSLSYLNLAALLSPVLIFCPYVVLLIASCAVLFEVTPRLSGGIGNAIYIPIWISIVVLGALSTGSAAPILDATGLFTLLNQLQAEVKRLDVNFNGSVYFGTASTTITHPQRLEWSGIHPSSGLWSGRMFWLGVSLCVLTAAIVIFDRFLPADSRSLFPSSRAEAQRQDDGTPSACFKPVGREKPAKQPTEAFSLVGFQLMAALRRIRWWWYTVAVVLLLLSLLLPLQTAEGPIMILAWIWPIMIWSELSANSVSNPVVLSISLGYLRQLAGNWIAGIIVAGVISAPVMLRAGLCGDKGESLSLTAAIFFVPTLAVGLGSSFRGRRAFQVIYILLWYIGPVQHAKWLDFIGTTPFSRHPSVYVIASLAIAGLSCVIVSAGSGDHRLRVVSRKTGDLANIS